MKTGIFIIVFFLGFLNVTLGQSKSPNDMITAVSVGYQQLRIGTIDQSNYEDLVPGGLPELIELSENNLQYGLTGFGVFGQWVAGFDLLSNQSEVRGDLSGFSRSEGRARGISVTIFTGYQVLRNAKWSAFPLVGLGIANNRLSYRITPQSPNQIPGQDFQNNRLNISNDHLTLDIGGGIHRYFQFARLKAYAATFGLRAGYTMRLATMNSRSQLGGAVTAAPTFGHSGFYLKLILGGGFWTASESG